MNLRARAADLTKALGRHPQYVVLALGLAFFLNVAFFVYAINRFPQNDRLLTSIFLLHLVWPIALIVFGILRLRRGNEADEAQTNRRREITLRYFAIGTLLLVIMLTAFWRYKAGYAVYYTSTLIVPPILVLSALLVIITWYWIKYSDNKLSKFINRAPRHFLFSAISFVITLIGYLAYSDVKDVINARALRELYTSDRLLSIVAVFQSITWIGLFATIGTAVLGYLRPSDTSTVTNDAIIRKRELGVPLVEPVEVNKDLELVPPLLKSNKLDRLISTVESNNHEIQKLLSQPLIASDALAANRIVSERFGLIRGRLTGELKELTKRGNLNLTIGILTTIGAASALFWGLIATQPLPNETQATGLLRHYLPRISFAIFIEVFSFFFLRLYKSSLEDIKYYHNELTNLDSRLLALEIAAVKQLPEALTPILLGLLNTDRNHILKSGESTVELEKIRTEQQYLRTVIDAISTKLPDFSVLRKGS